MQLGFQWELTLEKQWNDKFDKLKVYQQTYGDCNVPYNFSEDPNLGMWVKYQRGQPPSLPQEKVKPPSDEKGGEGAVVRGFRRVPEAPPAPDQTPSAAAASTKSTLTCWRG